MALCVNKLETFMTQHKQQKYAISNSTRIMLFHDIYYSVKKWQVTLAWPGLKRIKQNAAEKREGKRFGFTLNKVTFQGCWHHCSHCCNTVRQIRTGGFKPRAKSCVFSLSPLMGHAERGWWLRGRLHKLNRANIVEYSLKKKKKGHIFPRN